MHRKNRYLGEHPSHGVDMAILMPNGDRRVTPSPIEPLHHPRLRRPVRGERIVLEPQQGHALGLRTVDDRLDDRRRKQREA